MAQCLKATAHGHTTSHRTFAKYHRKSTQIRTQTQGVGSAVKNDFGGASIFTMARENGQAQRLALTDRKEVIAKRIPGLRYAIPRISTPSFSSVCLGHFHTASPLSACRGTRPGPVVSHSTFVVLHFEIISEACQKSLCCSTVLTWFDKE